MEPTNQNMNQQSSQAPSAQPVGNQPAPNANQNPQPQFVSDSPKKGGKMMIIFLITLIVIIFAAIGVVVYGQFSQKSDNSTTAPVTTNTVIPSETPTPTPQDAQTQIDNIDVGSPASDLDTLDNQVDEL